VRPGDHAAVHHVIVYTRPPEQPAPSQAAQQQGRPRPQPPITFAEGMDIPAGQTGGEPLPDGQKKNAGPNDRPAPKQLGPSVGAYVPGNGFRVYQPGTATKLIAGSTIIFQMHYTTTGKTTTDRTRIGLVFSKEPPKTPLVGTALINGGLHIKAGDPNARVDAEMTLNRD